MKMSKFYVTVFLSAWMITSCTSENKGTKIVETNASEENIKEVKLSFEERVERHITGSLSIPVTEKFTTKRYNAHLNADNFEDAIITVNRPEYAIKQAAKSPLKDKIAEMGYMGNYNYFVYYDGKLDKFSVPVPVSSSTNAPLNVFFENVISDSYMDLVIEYRIVNSSYKNYYVLSGGILQKIFQVKIFDYIGTEKPEAFFLEYAKGSISTGKDILVYEGKIKDYSSNIKDVYTYNPVIEKKGKLIYKWFYNPRTMQYMTQSRPPVD